MTLYCEDLDNVHCSSGQCLLIFFLSLGDLLRITSDLTTARDSREPPGLILPDVPCVGMTRTFDTLALEAAIAVISAKVNRKIFIVSFRRVLTEAWIMGHKTNER